jgi:hypothetical protein
MMKEYRNRVESLKAVEVFCYSLCVHLLSEEVLAMNAAKTVLLDLFADERFWVLEGEERDRRVRKQAIARSMEILTGKSKQLL